MVIYSTSVPVAPSVLYLIFVISATIIMALIFLLYFDIITINKKEKNTDLIKNIPGKACPMTILIADEQWNVDESIRLKNEGTIVRKLFLSKSGIKDEKTIPEEELEWIKTNNDNWNTTYCRLKWVPNSVKVAEAKEKQNLQIKLLSSEKQREKMTDSIEKQIQDRIKSQALQRSSSTTYGYPSSSRFQNLDSSD